MAFWKNKEGKEFTAKEFMKAWGRGIEGVSALQQVNMQFLFTIVTLIGLACGIGVSLYKWSSLWWLCIILIAGFGNTCISLIGLKQRRTTLMKIESMLNPNTHAKPNTQTNGDKAPKGTPGYV